MIRRKTQTFSTPLLHFSCSVLSSLCKEVDKTRGGCQVCHAAINKLVTAYALWNPETLYPFHVFPMSQGPDLWPLGFWLGYLRPKGERVSMCVCDGSLSWIGGWLSHDPAPPHLVALPCPHLHFTDYKAHWSSDTNTMWSGSSDTLQISSTPGWPSPFYTFLPCLFIRNSTRCVHVWMVKLSIQRDI